MSTHGFDDSGWESAKREVKKILIKRAKMKGTISYSELVENIHSIEVKARSSRLFHLLDEVSSEENAKGRGMIAAIVVHKGGDTKPGSGFFKLAERLGRDTSDELNCWRKELKKVHSYWSNQ